MSKQHYFYLGLGILVAMFTLGRCSRGKGNPGLTSNGPKGSATPVLPKQDKELISFNEKTHEITIQTAVKTIKEYAKNPVVEIRKDGSVDVSRHLAGFENGWFIGGGYADTGRLFLGDNVFHVGRFDLMGTIGWTPDNRYSAVRAFAGVNYLVYSNTSIGIMFNPVTLAVNHKPELGVLVSVKL